MVIFFTNNSRNMQERRTDDVIQKTVWTTKKEITPRYAGDNLSLFSKFFL